MTKTFNEITASDNTLMVIDSMNLAFRYKHAKAQTFAEDYVKTVESLKKSYKAKYVIIAADWGTSSYRSALLPQYKGNRKEKYEKETPAEKEATLAFFKEFTRTLELLRDTAYPVLRFEKCEADDIAGYICSKDLPVDHIWLMSSDKDWDLLVNSNVSRFSYVTRKEITLNNWYEHYDCSPEQFISMKCLTGDSGDNVPGVVGVGEKRALALLETYGDALELAANMPIPGKYKYIQAVNDFGADNIMLNYKLMDLPTYSAEALGEINCKEIDKVLEEYVH